MDILPLGKPDFGPLERACDSALQSIALSLEGNPSSKVSEVLRNFAAAIQSQRDEVLAIFAREHTALEAEYNELTFGINQLLQKDLPKLQNDLAGIPALVEKEKNKAATEIIAKSPTVQIPAGPKPTAFHSGGELLNTLMGLNRAGSETGSGVRTTGNIWENWKKTGE